MIGSKSLIKFIYEATFGVSLKKISLKNLELEKSDDESSILNKHLDEILYFFEQKEYNLVVFEDIDRFDSPSIFIKLRELNTLINQNEDINQNDIYSFYMRLKIQSLPKEKEQNFLNLSFRWFRLSDYQTLMI
jgi:predicted glycosyltransferase involved in capsule biosynthesis